MNIIKKEHKFEKKSDPNQFFIYLFISAPLEVMTATTTTTNQTEDGHGAKLKEREKRDEETRDEETRDLGSILLGRVDLASLEGPFCSKLASYLDGCRRWNSQLATSAV